MTTFNVHEAKTHLSKLLRRVMNGEEIIIARAGEPVAILAPINKVPSRRVSGIDTGKVIIHDDFDDPLTDFD
jgi:prevent-host-death family protein